jgi:competence protein ComEA
VAQHAEVHARLLQVVAVNGWVPGPPGKAGVVRGAIQPGGPVVSPESWNPESTSESTSPESASPESAGPESTGPESTGPESAGPESTSPESAGPESAGPESASPETQNLVEPPDRDRLGTFHARALASATAAYTAAHGHVLEADAHIDQPRRWATRARVAAVAAAALVLVGAVVVVRAVQQTPSVVVPVAAAGAAGPTTTPPPAGLEVVVHVVGQVVAPGLVHLPAGSRLADALDAAGGATPEADLAAVNLARVLTDGEQIVVPRPGEQLAGAIDAGSSGPGAMDLNAAGTGELDTLPGIGPVIAQRIVDWRTDHGGFGSVEELGEVSGIGPSLLDGVRDLVRVG